MIRILFFNSKNEWFSTASVDAWYRSNYEIAKDIKDEIEAHFSRFGKLGGYKINHQNQDVTEFWEKEMQKISLTA